jgi:UDP-glucose 4-epimerase
VKVLVTGGAGYVGGVSVDAILAAGHDVVVLDDLSTGYAAIVNAAARLVTGSYGNETATRALLETERVDAILHCAARSLVGESVLDPARYYRDNVAGGIALLEAARAAGVRRVVFSSTAAVYGSPESTPIPEEAVLRPINPYGETKRAFEGALHWYGGAYGFRSVILRYFNAAGATERLGEVHRPETHLVPNMLRAAAGGPALTLFGEDYPTPDGTPIRDYIHVADLADAHVAALEATAPDDPRTGPAGGSAPASPVICNLGTAGGFSVREVLRAAEDVVGRPIPHAVGPRRAGDPPVLVASTTRAREVLGWIPRRSSLEEMLGSAWAWRRAHPDGYGD